MRFIWCLCTAMVSCTFGTKGAADACEDGTFVSPSGWANAATYPMAESNFSCDEDPVDGALLVDPDTFTTYGRGIGSDADIHVAISAALTLWNGVAASVELRHTTSDVVDLGVSTQDNEHHLYMVDDYNATQVAAAATSAWYDASHPEYGYSDCDVKFYNRVRIAGTASYLSWDANDAPSDTEVSMPAVIAHEAGHCLGLGDNAIPGSMMNGEITEGESRAISDDDESALRFIYEE